MNKFYRYIFILIILFTTPLLRETNVYAADEGSDNLKFSWQIREYFARSECTRTNKLMELLKIRPGMTVLDIGTGVGYYACKFAEKLKGTGKVFATDIRIESINYVAEEARKRGLENLYPILVKKGVDEFYSELRFDLIFLSHVYLYLDDPVDYLKRMRNSLAEDGQLAIVDYKSRCLRFYLNDFTDFEGLIKELSLEDKDSPFYKALRESTRELIKQKSNGQPDQSLKNAVVDDFNMMLPNPHLYSEFLNRLPFEKELSLTPEERDFIYRTLLLLNLRAKGDITQKKELSAREVMVIMMLNKLFIIQRFRQYLYKGGMAPYLSRAIGNEIHLKDYQDWIGGWTEIRKALKEAGYKLKGEYNLVPYERKIMEIDRVLGEAGYRLKGEYDFIPFEFILIFTDNKDVKGK
jgi:ubiquinone/menaquinone biosynthesis C-methylase UbiE